MTDFISTYGSLASLIGIPTVIGFLLFLHKKHISILKDQISLLEKEKQRLEDISSDSLIEKLKRRREAYEILLSDAEERKDDQTTKYEERIVKLNEKIEQLSGDLEIITLMENYRGGDDYRYEILREQQKEK